MENFKPYHNSNNNRTRYKYYPAEEGQMIKVSIDFRDGGMNYFSSRVEKRGIEIAITSVTVGGSGSGVRSEQSTPFADINGRLLLVEAKRYNAGKIQKIAEALDEKVPELSRIWAEDREAGRALLNEMTQIAAAV